MVRRILVLGSVVATLVACSSSAGPVPSGSGAAVRAAPATNGGGGVPATLSTPVISAAPDDPYCEALASVDALDAVQQLAGDAPESVEAAVTAAGSGIEQIATAAPAAVAQDWATIASAYGRVFDAYRAAGFDFSVLMADPASAGVFEHLGAREFLDAGDRVEQYSEAACDVSIGLGRTPITEPSDGGAGPVVTDPAVDPADDSTISDDDAAQVGALLLEEFSIEASAEQQACFGRAVSDPTVIDTASGEDATDALDLYRQLAAGCGIDTSGIG